MFAPTLMGSFAASSAPSIASRDKPGASSLGPNTAGSPLRDGRVPVAPVLVGAVRDRLREAGMDVLGRAGRFVDRPLFAFEAPAARARVGVGRFGRDRGKRAMIGSSWVAG